jgi:hypothetical protein
MKYFAVFLILMLVPISVATGQQTSNISRSAAACRTWYAAIDPQIKRVYSPPSHQKIHQNAIIEDGLKEFMRIENLQNYDPDNVTSLTDEEALAGMKCLFRLEKVTRPSRFTSQLKLAVSQLFSPAPINLAALYYINYLYTGNLNYAGAVALIGPNAAATDKSGKYVTKQSAIQSAYAAYKTWFETVQKTGLKRSRELKLSPLKGSGLEWYGPVTPMADSSQTEGANPDPLK